MKIVFMGTPHLSIPVLERIVDDGHEILAVYTQPDRTSGRGRRKAISPLKNTLYQKITWYYNLKISEVILQKLIP